MKKQKEAIIEVECVKPLRIDYTCLIGAARAFSKSELNNGVLPFSRIMSLSQLVEALVLHENITYELGNTDEWIPYRKALEESEMLNMIKQHYFRLSPDETQIDASISDILDAANWAAEKALSVPGNALEYAIRHRSGSYDGIANILDLKNPTILHYLHMIRTHGDGALNDKMAIAQTHLINNKIGILGIHILMRIGLITKHLGNNATYFPHFSRQPLIRVIEDPLYELKFWTLELLQAKRIEILGINHPHEEADHPSAYLSPVFLACLANSRRPEDIIIKAYELRCSGAAKEFRRECEQVYRESFWRGPQYIEAFKTHIWKRIRALNDLFVESGVKEELIIEGGFYPYPKVRIVGRKTFPQKQMGDNTCVFLSNILRDAIGIMAAIEKISEVFGVICDYDANILD